MTFRKVTPAALKVNVKKFWQVLLVPWHVWAPIWVHFAPWWSIFPVKNRFSHIFPVPGGLPFLTVILTVKLARLDISSDAILVSFLSCLRIKAFKRKESFTSGHHHFQFSTTIIEDDRCRSGKGRRLERCRPTCFFSPGRFVAPRRQPCWQNQKKTT